MAPQISADVVVEAAPAAPKVALNQMVYSTVPVPVPIITVVSKHTVTPEGASPVGDLKLSVSDMPMLSCHYIQKGLFFPPTGTPMAGRLVSSLLSSLSRALGVFPALAGRLVTLPDGRIVIRCADDAAVEFYHAVAPALSLGDFLVPDADVPTRLTKDLFPMDRTVSYEGHRRPLTSFQVTVLGDGAVFVGFVANHAVVDGTSFWHFFNTWAGLCRGEPVQPPDFSRNFFGGSTAVIRFAGRDGPAVTFDAAAPLRERVVHFSAAAIRDLKAAANRCGKTSEDAETNGKLAHDSKVQGGGRGGEISSFQSMCAHMWRAVTRARLQLAADATTTFRMAVNCRHRLRPKISSVYFGNAIQSVATTATVAELAAGDLGWAASRLHATVVAHEDGAIRQAAADWEAAPRCFPLGNPDGAALTMGSSPRFPMYDGNDFGWGRAVAVRSGRANKFDGKMSAFPGQAGDGSVDVEVCLAPDTMARLLDDDEFLQYASRAH